MMLLAALLLAHITTDFLLQPKAWVRQKQAKKAGSVWLYIHSSLAGGLAYLFCAFALNNWHHWPILVITLFSHFAIDLWKLHKGDTATTFFIDQLLHVVVILGLAASYNHISLIEYMEQFTLSTKELYHLLFIVFLTFPAGIILSKFLKGFQAKENRAKQTEQVSLPQAGLWIGVFERLIIYFLVVNSQFLAITFLITAKSILRLAPEKDRQQSEYILVGTLASLFLAFILGLLIKTF